VPSSVGPAAVTVGGEGPATLAAPKGAARVAALPCHYSDNCIGKFSDRKPASLSPYRKKGRHRLEMAIEWMVMEHDLAEDLRRAGYTVTGGH
jgi:hypothetical protein